MLLGFSPNAILSYLVLTQPLVLIQHANIDFKSGRANYILSTNEAHRWHHSTMSSEANSNFGNALLIWDHIFGTFRAPDGFSKEKRVGLFSSNTNYPAKSGYWLQIKSMFNPRCCLWLLLGPWWKYINRHIWTLPWCQHSRALFMLRSSMKSCFFSYSSSSNRWSRSKSGLVLTYIQALNLCCFNQHWPLMNCEPYRL